jgi:hypothetical protein
VFHHRSREVTEIERAFVRICEDVAGKIGAVRSEAGA